jgi:hypothetical protein
MWLGGSSECFGYSSIHFTCTQVQLSQRTTRHRCRLISHTLFCPPFLDDQMATTTSIFQRSTILETNSRRVKRKLLMSLLPVRLQALSTLILSRSDSHKEKSHSPPSAVRLLPSTMGTSPFHCGAQTHSSGKFPQCVLSFGMAPLMLRFRTASVMRSAQAAILRHPFLGQNRGMFLDQLFGFSTGLTCHALYKYGLTPIDHDQENFGPHHVRRISFDE